MAREGCSLLVLVVRPKKQKVDKEKATTSKTKPSTDKPVKTSDSKAGKASTDAKITKLDQRWSVGFNGLEALLMARTPDREPTFQTVKVAANHYLLTLSSSQPMKSSLHHFLKINLELTPLLPSIILPANITKTNPSIKSRHTERQ